MSRGGWSTFSGGRAPLGETPGKVLSAPLAEGKTVRERTEEIEEMTLSPFAVLSSKSKGRLREEKPCPVRTCFQRDRDRIIHSKAFRRLKDKTQVFLAPEADHFRTRLTHTLEVSQIARTIARGLRLNEDLTEAIALGHDLGHTPFGHAGEEVLDRVHPGGFRHNEQSLRVVDVLERGGLNLTWEVRDGILNHPWRCRPSTLEGRCVQVSDRIAYVNHDIDDAIRAGIIKNEDLPEEALEILGRTHAERINTLVTDVIENSFLKEEVGFTEDCLRALDILRNFLFERVYIGSIAKREEDKAKGIVEALYTHYCSHPEEIVMESNKEEEPSRRACDYVAGMTDRYAITQYKKVFVPRSWVFEEP
ncbi:MAG TPA: deoxyguanosinetriphosphate triphosphohydrolase [Firmicutes bacterium]|nr:deoxyguanosinetriphosphate triphosphohydrolase [Candidatus Fermentithermobacillaceae bacterium]